MQTQNSLPRFLTLKELLLVAIEFNIYAPMEPLTEVYKPARLGKEDYIAAVKAMAGEGAIRAYAGDEEKELNNRAVELSQLVTEALKANDFERANKLSGELGDISAQKLALVDNLIEQKLAEMYGGEKFDHNTQAILWYQDKKWVKVFLLTKFGFAESTGELVLLPVGDNPKKPFIKAEAGKIAVCYPEQSPNGKIKVLHVLGFIEPQVKPTTLYRNVSVFIGKDNSNNATKSVSAFDTSGWKVVIETKARIPVGDKGARE